MTVLWWAALFNLYKPSSFVYVHLLYIQAGDVQMDNASLQAVHHTGALVMCEQVFHDGCR